MLATLHRLTFDAAPSLYERGVQDVERTFGVFTSGGALANLSALWLARNMARGPTAEREGLHAELGRNGYALDAGEPATVCTGEEQGPAHAAST